MRSLILPVLAAATLAGSAAPAFAESLPTVTVSYKDLNLANAAGRQALEARIATAIDTVCARPVRASLKEAQAWAECRELTAARAERQMSQVLAAAEVSNSVQVASAE